MFSLITRLLLISLSICFIQSYKLNVPKVLLPFHSSKLISFTLEAKSETESASSDEICFNWSSSRPDVVTITPIYTDSRSKCSNKAVVSAVSKHPQRLTSIIFAHETKTDKLIRCDVIVDQINQIRIKHTTTHLYLEDSPECFTAEALDDEGNTFSSIDGLAFEWSILNDDGGDSEQLAASVDSRNVLKISKFIDSEYEVSDSIKQLESVGLTGHKILIEGLKTGQANVQAKLVDPFYKSVLKSPLVRLLVVANLLLEPSYPVYLVPGAEIKYTVSLIKQHSVEKISLPGSQYYFESRNSSIADLAQGDKTQSVVVAKNLGTTDVVLIDRNMREEMLIRRNNNQVDQQLVVPPPSATIHVVTPDHLVFSIKNWRSWILEVGRRYEIVIQVVSTQRMQIYSSDNLVIESQFDAGKFGVNYQSANGSYNYVAAREKGVTVARASLKGTRALLSGEIIQFDWVARGEQEIELLDPIDVIPKIVIFALKSSHLDSSRDQVLTSVSAYEYRLQASGGSGTYYWQSKNTTIASVSAQGLVRTTATKLGQTTVTVTDVRNTDIQAKSIIYVLEPVDLAIQACPVETQVGSKLYLNIQMNAYVPTNTNSDQSDSTPTGSTIMPITDCSRLPFDVSILDESVFKFISIQSPTSTRSTDSSCAIVVLDSLRPGRTTIKLSYAGSHISDMLASNEIQIGSYSMLKSHKTLITLAKDSSLVLNLYDGPLFSSLSSSQAENAPGNVVGVAGYQSDVVVSDRQLLDVTTLESESHAQLNRYSYVVKCKGTSGDEGEASVSTVKFSLSHKKSPVNRCPLAFDYKLKVRCADPTSLELSQLFVNNEENTGNVLSTMKWKCPIKQSSHVATAHSQRPLYIQLTARDSLGNVFDNFTSLKTEWQIGDRALLDKTSGSPSIDSFEVAALDDSALMLLHPNEDVPNSNRLFYQRFQTKSAPIGSETKIALKMFITDEKVHTEEHHKHKHHHLSGTLNIRFVSDVRIEPETLTVFNHPSNIIPLGLSRGSGHYQAEIETALDTTLSSTTSSTPAAQQLSPALKINQINENSVVVSPSANNGLTYLNVYDYCVPPAMPKSLDDEGDQGDQDTRRRLPPSIHRNRVLTWPPYATAKIHVAGINSILVNYEDDKVQVKNGLKVYVQISDATGNLIRTKYFPLMNLRAKLANVESNAASNLPNSAVSGQQTSFQSQSKQDLSLATIELDQSSRSLIDEFTAVYVLNGLKKGVVSVQFEAQSDGYDSTTKRAAAAVSSDNLIQSGIKDIQIYGPLRVQPKYIELIRGAQYQVLVSGGPVSLDATINYEVVVIEKRGANSKADAKIIDVDASKGLIDALELGKVKVVVKSIGHACQPFSAKAATQSPPPPSRCTPESKIVRVYSEDTLIVNVVELRSVQIHAPLRSIKRGNEMPVYLMANEKSLSALNFASSPSLKYHWRLNDPQIGELYHPLIEDALGTTTATSESDESYGLFEKAFSLRLLAKQSGSVKISVRVEFLNSKNQLTSLTDSIDIQVFDEAQFTHFAPSYFSFKHPLISKSSKSGTPTINTYQLLMSPGTQLQVRTNFDNLATKISYELKFYQASNLASGDDQTTSSSSSIICSNSTIRVNNEGLLIATGLKHLQIKNFQECTATLLVTVLMASGNGETKLSTSVATKQQTLAYTVRVKPVVYAMLKLNRNSIAKLTETVKFKLSRQSLIKNRLQLNSGGVQMKWHVRYYDNLGDTFDVVNTNNLYAVNRHDLVDFSNMNTNLFELTAQSYQQQQQAALNTDGTVPTTTSRDSVSDSIAANDKPLSSISIVANAVENSFTLRTIERGMFIMELSPLAAKRSESSRDYIGLNIGSLNTDFETTSAGEFDSIAGRSRIEANLGDLICLTRHDSSFQDENDDSSSKREHETETQWTSQVSNVVKLISSDPWTQIGVCVSSGHSNLRKSTAPPHDSLLGLVEVAVRPLERVRFLSRSVKHISNAQSTEVSNSIQFQVVGGSPASQNCSAEFENAIKANSRQQEQFNPFKCSASLFTESGRRLAYLDRLITPTVAFSGQYWFCEVKFVPESQALMYDLIENHIDRPLASKLSSNQLAEEFSHDNEPALIVIQIGSKSGEEIGGSAFDEDQSNSQQRAHSLPFVPAFFTTTKQIELLICGNRIGAQNRRIAGLSESASHDHVQLTIHTTHSLRSHLILTSNCPTLIKIKEHDNGVASQQFKPAVSSSGASTSTTPLLSLTYEVSATDDVNDLNTFASLLQQLKGEIYVQVTCSLTQQIERIPVRFVFGAGLTTADAIRYSDFRSRSGTSTRSDYAYSFWYNPLGYILDLTPSQTSSFLVLLIVALLTLLVVLRFWSPASSSTQQIAMNAQAAAAATAAAMISQQQRGSPKDHSSFNPYRYFSSSLDQVPNMDYNRSPSPHSFRRMPMSPQNANESYYATPRGGVFTGSPTKPPVERDSIRLFSTDANVFVRPRQPQDNTMNLSFRNNASRTYNDTSFSDHE